MTYDDTYKHEYLCVLASLQDGPQWSTRLGFHTLVKFFPIPKSTDLRIILHKWWCMISKTKSQGFCLTLSLIILSGRSQLPCHEDPPTALRRVPHSRGFRDILSRASINLPTMWANHLRSGFSSLASGLQMTVAPDGISTVTSWQTLSQNHPAKPLPIPDP